jgi:hypothetical protein
LRGTTRKQSGGHRDEAHRQEKGRLPRRSRRSRRSFGKVRRRRAACGGNASEGVEVAGTESRLKTISNIEVSFSITTAEWYLDVFDAAIGLKRSLANISHKSLLNKQKQAP